MAAAEAAGDTAGSTLEAASSSARRRRPSMTDVAALAGVSYQTVSRVINAQAGVRPSTQARVLAAMEQLSYQPSSVARSLVSGRSRSIGVISTGSALFGPSTTLHTVDEAVRAAGYATMIASVSQLDREGILAGSRQLISRAVDGIIISGSPHLDAMDVTLDLLSQLPVIVIGRAPRTVPAVDTDAFSGARKAVRHLLDLGHRTVFHVTGPQGWSSARRRLEGWRKELTQHGSEVPPPIGGDWSAASGYAAGLEIARRGHVTAVFAANDHIALGLIRAFSEAGRIVPDDISLVGFDDVPESAYYTPPLTTVRQELEACSEIAVRRLVRAVEGHDAGPITRKRVPELIVRSSTAPPAVRGHRVA